MKISVIGATGGSGLAAVRSLISTGHEVTAFARHPERIELSSERLRRVQGDVLDPADLTPAIAGQDAVIVTLGITENPIRVRLFGPAHTDLAVRSTGSRHVIAAMNQHQVRRLVVQTSYGVGATRDRLRLADRLFFALLLAPQIADTELQDRLVAESGLDWTLVQPVHLNDDEVAGMPFWSTTGVTGKMSVSRAGVGRFLAHAAQTPALIGQSVALSGAHEKAAMRELPSQA